jgi:dihydroorotate dehydrogenase
LFDYYRVIGPFLRRIDAENAHRLTIRALRTGIVPALRITDDPILVQRLWGRTFSNPIGLAAGFDKNAEVTDAMLAQGFGFVEVGTVTPRPQPGNPRPRIFRLPEDEGLINRLGFNNEGLAAVARRLAARSDRRCPGLVGANVGPNRDSPDPIADCADGVRTLAPLADYLVVNVSSPNTPGLRAMQDRAPLARLLQAVLTARNETGVRPPLLVKIAPDLSAAEIAAVVEVAMAAGIDGLVATNTTVDRPPGLAGGHRQQTGGLSGRPLFAPSTAVLAEVFRLTKGSLPLIGVGGVAGGAEAYAKIRAGAALVQLYTALIYQGPALVGRIRRELAARLRADGLTSVAEAVGADVR